LVYFSCAKSCRVPYYNLARLSTKSITAKTMCIKEAFKVKRLWFINEWWTLTTSHQELKEYFFMDMTEQRHDKKLITFWTLLLVTNRYGLIEEKTIADVLLEKIICLTSCYKLKDQWRQKRWKILIIVSNFKLWNQFIKTGKFESPHDLDSKKIGNWLKFIYFQT
jgi:hypothetical protein